MFYIWSHQFMANRWGKNGNSDRFYFLGLQKSLQMMTAAMKVRYLPLGRNAMTNLVKVKVAQSCPTLCDPMNCTVHGILQSRILEWIAFPFSRGSSQPRDQTRVSRIAGGFFTS